MTEHYLKYKQTYKRYYLKNRLKILNYVKKYNKNHKELRKKIMKKYNETHKKETAIQKKKYYQLNKIKHIKYGINYNRRKYQTDIKFRLITCLRGRFRKALKRISKKSSIIKLLGCSTEQLKKHLEKQFKSGMNWNNYGKWHVDHIRPCASFDLSKASEQKKCFNYKNLQPLWAKDNLRKARR